MNAVSSFRQGLEDIDRQWCAGHFAQALTQVDRLLEEWPSNPHLLVLRAELIQLQDTCEGPTLDDVKADLECAVELDPDSPAPLIELGHFLLAVEDDAGAAAQCFQTAMDLGVRLLKDAQDGRDQAREELGMNVLETTYVRPDEDNVLRVGRGRVMLDSVVAAFAQGHSPETIRQQYPSLSLEEVYGAITYYLAHRDEVEQYLRRQDAIWNQWRARSEQAPGPVVERLRAMGRARVPETS
jgi:hypothetical protein